jgi:hypothetical protein
MCWNLPEGKKPVFVLPQSSFYIFARLDVFSARVADVGDSPALQHYYLPNKLEFHFTVYIHGM